MTTYYMTSKRNSEVGYWEKCKATTLTGAKREATTAYSSGYLDAIIAIAEGDGITEPRREISSKLNSAHAKWANHE